MTKAIRIENADTSNHKVQILVMAPGRLGAPDTVVRTLDLNLPAQQITEYVHSGQYLVVKEVPA